ncbi:COQ9 family protein [Hellea sp.]|nr:COQ9 family protein [Hellea sp.]
MSKEVRVDILQAMLPIVVFDGWNQKSLRASIKLINLPEGSEELYFPEGALEVIRFWHDQMNEFVKSNLESLNKSEMKIREQVTAGVLSALESIGSNEEAMRRAIIRLSLPDAAVQGPTYLWSLADSIWRAIGDRSTDYNYYTKRTILAGVLGSTITVWISDSDQNKVKTKLFLDARISNVMSFEKSKFKIVEKINNIPNFAEILGRLRYGNNKNRCRKY